MTRLGWRWLVCVVVLGCGGARGNAGRADAPDPLGERLEIPGTGVSLQPPRGAAIIPVGPGLFVEDLDVTLMVSVLSGGSVDRDAVARSFALDRETASPRPLLLDDGVRAELGRDLAHAGGAVRPRLWLLAADSGRVLTVMATFPDERDATVVSLVERSLETVQWTRDQPLDAARAIGLTLGDVEGLTPDASSVGTLALVPPGTTFPPPEGQPFVLLLPLPHAVPDAPDIERCMEILDDTRVLATRDGEVLPLDYTDAVRARSTWGCHAEGEHVTSVGTHLYAHASVVFLEVGPFLVTGMVAPAGRTTWSSRFETAGQNLRSLSGRTVQAR